MDLVRRTAAITCLAAALSALVAVPTTQAAASRTRVPKAWAKLHHVGPLQGTRDGDKDGLTNWGEYRAGTDPRRRDSDRDGLSDALENRDGDRLVNADEVAAGTDPRRRDSDGDGLPDGREDRDGDGLPNADERPSGHDLTKRDTDGDGTPDGRDNAGKVTAVSPTSVTIRRFVGAPLTATLSADSWVDCDATAPAPTGGASPGTGTGRTPDAPGTGGSGGIGNPDGADAPATDPIAGADPTIPPPPDPDPVEEDPARAPAYATLLARPFQSPEDGDDADPWDPSGEDAISPPDLGTCATALRVGAIVHTATVDGAVLTELELMRP